MHPVIGIVSCGFIEEKQFVTQTYLNAVASAGAVPVIIPLVSDSSMYPYYKALCDGFLFCGGEDITPLLFGEEPMTSRGSTDTGTDLSQLSLMEYILNSNLPVLAICRGMQILNIVLGGSIWQDISLRPGPSLNHMQLSDNRQDVSHKITVSSNSMLYNICRENIFVNSYHHQCVKVLGDHLKITGVSSDGVIEAVESVRHTFVMGVQWHPECMCHSDQHMADLFKLFTSHAKTAKMIMLP